MLGQTVGGEVRRYLVGFGDGEDAEKRIVNFVGLAQRAFCIPASEFAVNVDYSAGIRDKIRRVKNPAPFEFIAVAFFEELVVRRAGDNLHFEPRNRFIIDHASERAGGKDVTFLRDNLLRVHRCRIKLIDHAAHTLGVHVRNQ